MADKKISNLPAAASIVGTDVVAGVTGDTTVKVQAEEILMVQSTSDIRYEDLRVPVTSTRLGGSKDPDFAVAFKTIGDTSQGVFLEWFDHATEEELYFSAQIPHAYKEGTDIYPHVHWVPEVDGASGEQVCWGLEYVWANIGDTFTTTTLIFGDTQTGDTHLVEGRHYYTSLGTISGTGKTISSMLLCRIFRDATGTGGTDDYGDDAGLLEIDFHYQVDAIGSSEELTK